MIYDPDTQKWLRTEDCVWEAKVDFLPTFTISKHYPDCQRLFSDCLGIGNATLDMVLEALDKLPLPEDVDLSILRSRLIGLSQYLYSDVSHEMRKKFTESACVEKPLIPVTKLDKNGKRVIEYRRINQKRFLLFNDIWRYDGCFEDSIALFSVTEVLQLKPLIREMKLCFGGTERLLSEKVLLEKDSGQSCELSEQHTMWLRQKFGFLKR